MDRAPLQAAASKGDGRAAFELAKLCVSENKLADAERWLKAGAHAGNPDCMHLLAMRLHGGEPPMSPRRTEAIRLDEKAAGLGHTGAMCGLAIAYDNGWGVQKNPVTAQRWLEKAAAR
jgi:TPR repeat protein